MPGARKPDERRRSTSGGERSDLLRWKSFHVGALHVTSPPTSVAIRDVALTNLQSRIVIFPDGRFNLQEALAAPGETATRRRATAVQAALARTVEGAASRLFLVTPRLGHGTVELKLKS
jgi:hypothetical protein